jgi:hypothetical protein
MDLAGKSVVPEQIHTGNFADTLARTMLGELPAGKVEESLSRMPPWAAALASLTVGFKQMEDGELAGAAASFSRYHKLPADDHQRWAFNLQALGEKLARQCAAAARALDDVDKLEKEGKFGPALEALRSVGTNATLTALKTTLLTRESQLQQAIEKQREQLSQAEQQADRQRREREEKERQQALAEKKLLQTFEPELAPLWQSYDFKGVLARYEAFAPKLQTSEVQKLLEQRKVVAKKLVEFKSVLAADFARRPYDRADLWTRNDTPLAGRLVRATDAQLVFATPYGELVTDWQDLAPATVVKLAEFYLASRAHTEKAEPLARRHFGLAVFCKQYGPERAATGYARQATRMMPALQTEADAIFGKPAN